MQLDVMVLDLLFFHKLGRDNSCNKHRERPEFTALIQ